MPTGSFDDVEFRHGTLADHLAAVRGSRRRAA